MADITKLEESNRTRGHLRKHLGFPYANPERAKVLAGFVQDDDQMTWPHQVETRSSGNHGSNANEETE